MEINKYVHDHYGDSNAHFLDISPGILTSESPPNKLPNRLFLDLSRIPVRISHCQFSCPIHICFFQPVICQRTLDSQFGQQHVESLHCIPVGLRQR